MLLGVGDRCWDKSEMKTQLPLVLTSPRPFQLIVDTFWHEESIYTQITPLQKDPKQQELGIGEVFV